MRHGCQETFVTVDRFSEWQYIFPCHFWKYSDHSLYVGCVDCEIIQIYFRRLKLCLNWPELSLWGIVNTRYSTIVILKPICQIGPVASGPNSIDLIQIGLQIVNNHAIRRNCDWLSPCQLPRCPVILTRLYYQTRRRVKTKIDPSCITAIVSEHKLVRTIQGEIVALCLWLRGHICFIVPSVKNKLPWVRRTWNHLRGCLIAQESSWLQLALPNLAVWANDVVWQEVVTTAPRQARPVWAWCYTHWVMPE